MTPLQKKAVPSILKGKDTVLETVSGEGRTATFLIPLMIYASGSVRTRTADTPASPSALIVTSQYRTAFRINKQYLRFSRKKADSASFTILGKPGAQRQESQILSKNPDIVAGTGEGIIDHIRRGNLSLSDTEYFVLDEPGNEDTPGFTADVQFILSKATKRKQTILITPAIQKAPPQLLSEMRMPSIITRDSWAASRTEHYIFRLGSRADAGEDLADIFESRRFRRTLIFAGSPEEAEALRRTLRRRNIRCRFLMDSARLSIRNKTGEYFNAGKIDAIILVHTSQFYDKLRNVENVIYFTLPRDAGQYLKAEAYFHDSDHTCRIFSLVRENEETLLEQIQERQNVKMKQVDLPNEEDVLKGTIGTILRKIKEEENPDELNQYRRFIRKNVPFFLRGYFAAYLLKESQQKKGRQKRGEFTTLFVGVGKNRRVFPRDLSQLFQSSLKIRKSDLGEIKVLDNYSFVDISPEYAQQAIDELNGTQMKGRRINVNFARKKENSKS